MKGHIATLAAAGLLIAACQQGPGGGTMLGAGAGAAAGAGIGLLTADGDDGTDQRQRALIGAGIGALAGGAVGYFLDQQEQQLNRDLQGTGVSVQRDGDTLDVIFPDVTFRTDSAELEPQFYGPLNSVAGTLKQYRESYINVYGHTDSTGSTAYNQDLSERRAQAVAAYLAAQGVDPARMLTRGYGETLPIDTNETIDGRSRNRRVEVEIVPFT